MPVIEIGFCFSHSNDRQVHGQVILELTRKICFQAKYIHVILVELFPKEKLVLDYFQPKEISVLFYSSKTGMPLKKLPYYEWPGTPNLPN